ncbi:hypothetical protein LY28_01130 [Ruminiclostridium sufflavum DSM 19573]|uniref:NACHT domain-containing protein n=1 Tax=Ruminiclostridium sufflavum DSM 19573 TaxID=1121337 RepID=A0A318Y0D1_9FIRM|nr:ATP-binding protein [Ruminiclostridium sufflavum]PYG88774.1 hypothetical protein LY28_01130 [Ruminiclostridium sufflavum DSM 19573]
MNWTNFQTYNDAPTKAFEVLCNQLFENWCKAEYSSHIDSFSIVNGAGGDGGVESFAVLINGEIIGLQAKWFPSSISESQINQIKNSIKTAMKVRPQIVRYIVCIPRDLASLTGKGENSEDKRWNEMQATMSEEFPTLSIDLWNETRLISELQKESSAGIYKFWFKNAEVSEENARFSFNKSKESWLSTKYVPELNTYGEIDNCISEFLGNQKQRNAIRLTFESFCMLCEAFSFAADELISVCGDNDLQLSLALTDTKNHLTAMKYEIDKALAWLNHETIFNISIDESDFWIDIDTLTQQLKESKEEYHHHFHFYEVSKVLRKLEKVDMQEAIKILMHGNDRKSLIFLGEPGTGKTHGVAAETEKLLDDGNHIPILIQARDIPAGYMWKDIIISSLGLTSDWSEDEIWQALSSLSNRKRFHAVNSDTQMCILPKIIIIVDGVDESSLPQKWIQLIQETNAIVQKYPQIRFCFTSRPYIIDSNANYARIIKIGASGDSPTYKLFSSYAKAYNIDITNVGWIKYALTTPLSLKLFCDINKGKPISYHDRTDVSITMLLKEKIYILEKEFCSRMNVVSVNNQYILRAIRLVSAALYDQPRIEKNVLTETILKELTLQRSQVEMLMQYLGDYGILRLFCEHSSRYLSLDTYYYYPGIQGYFDYASALMLLDEYSHPQNINFEKYMYIQKNTLYALTIIAIQNCNYLITSNATIDNVANPWFKEELLFIALRHSNPSNAQTYKERLLQIMSGGAEPLMSITNNVVLPLARDIQHPLGSALLDKFLSSFINPADRDIMWSIPCYLKGTHSDKWYYTKELALNDDEYVLSNDDMAGGCPVIYAWGLSSVNNLQRKFYRDSLMKWAQLAPNEFYKLFLKFSTVNDPQIRSDIFSILMSLLFEDENQKLIKEAADWLITNILAPDKIQENYDISIRYYSCAIVQKAISLGVIDKKEAESFLPPYKPVSNYILLNKDALSGTRMGGYSGIDYDLARYVLIDHFTSCFSDYDRRVKNQYEKLIKLIAKEQPEYKGISTDQFIISAAFAFVTQCGWNEEIFQYYDREKKKARGVDCAISGSYHSATHGSQSQVMTICEKYVWQARNVISGFLSDRLLYCDDDKVVRVTDYGLLDDFIIPAQELNQIDPDNIPEDHPWHIPEKEVVILEGQYNTKEDVINSIIHSPDVEWIKWLFINNNTQKYSVESNNLAALEGYSCFYGSTGVETCLFISSILISSDDIDKFLDILRDDPDLADNISNPVDWQGGIYSSCYITPKEVCWSPWKKRYNSRFVDDFPQLDIQSAVDKCCYNFQEYGDVYYDLPSLPVRDLLHITNSDGYLFCDNQKKVKAEYCITGEKWRTYQDYLLVDKKELLTKAEEIGSKILWIMREYRREDGKSKEKLGEFYAQKDCCSIGFFKNGEFITRQISTKQDSKVRIH